MVVKVGVGKRKGTFFEANSNTRGSDKLEVRVCDSTYNPYYRKRVDISNGGKMMELVKDLKNMGIDLSAYDDDSVDDNFWK